MVNVLFISFLTSSNFNSFSGKISSKIIIWYAKVVWTTSDILPLSNSNIAFASCSKTLFLSTFLNSLKIILFSSDNLIISSLDFPEILNLKLFASSFDLKLN